MKGLVLVKQVPDANSVFRINSDGSWVDESNLSFAINDYDRYGLEELLTLRDSGKLTEVVALTVSPTGASSVLRTCLMTGADRAIHVQDEAIAGADPLSLARIIQTAIADEDFHLIVAGLQADDDNHTQIGGLVAGLLDWPFASAVMSLTFRDETTLRVERELGNNELQVVDLTLPAVVTVQTGINAPRYASLKSIMAAKKKPLKKLSLADLGLEPSEVGGLGARLKSVSLSPLVKGKRPEILSGSPDEIAQKLVGRIREKTGVI